MTGESGRIEWSHNPSDTRIGLAFAYVFVGFIGGLLLFVASALLLIAVFAVAGGNFFMVGFVVLLTLVGGPVSLLYLWPLLRHPEQRPPFPDWVTEFRLRWVLLASLLGALAIAFSPSSEFFPFVVIGALVPLLVLWLFTSEGEIDTETRTLRYGDGNEIELDGITDVKRLPIRKMTLLWLSFPRGRPPRLVVLPSETERTARPVFEQAAARSVDPHTPNRTVQAVLVAFAFVFFGVAAVLAYSGWTTANGAARLGYAVVVLMVFGIIFAVTAAYGT